MKKLIILLIIGLLIGCAKRMDVQLQNPVCPKEGSWICEQSERMDVQPETVYGWIYSASAIAAVSDVASIEEICNFEKKIADWYVEVYPVSYDSLISFVATQTGLIKDAKKAMLIKGILNQYLTLYKSEEFISPADDDILRKGHAKFRKDMFCE